VSIHPFAEDDVTGNQLSESKKTFGKVSIRLFAENGVAVYVSVRRKSVPARVVICFPHFVRLLFPICCVQYAALKASSSPKGNTGDLRFFVDHHICGPLVDPRPLQGSTLLKINDLSVLWMCSSFGVWGDKGANNTQPHHNLLSQRLLVMACN